MSCCRGSLLEEGYGLAGGEEIDGFTDAGELDDGDSIDGDGDGKGLDDG